MEKIAQDLRLSELKQGNLCKTFEELHRAFSEWKELENNLNSSRSLLQSAFSQLVKREKEVISKEKQLDDQEIQFNKELELKLEQLQEIESLSEDLSKELDAKKQHVESLKSLIQQNSKELEVKEEQHNAIKNSIEEKEREYDHIEKSISREAKMLDLLEKSKQLKFEENQEMLKKYEDVTELKESRLNEMQRSLEKCMKERESKEEQLKVLQSSIYKCERKIKLKEEKLSSIQNSIAECSNELKLKEKQLLLDRKLKEKNCDSLKKSAERCAHEFEVKERKFESFVALKEEELESNFEELTLINQKVNECLKEVEEREKKFASLKRSIEELSHELEMKESEFERRVNEFKFSQQEFESIRKSDEVKEKSNILHSVVKMEKLEQAHTSLASRPSFMTKGKKDLLGLLNQHLEKHALICNEIYAVLQASSDPAKLVLEAEHGIYRLRPYCNLLSELLIKALPEINAQEREEAMKIASDWKAKMKVKSTNCLEVLDLFKFLVSFRLASASDVNELCSLLDIAGLNRQATKILPAICTVDKAPDVVESIQNLIQRGEIIHAVKHVCQLKLTDKISPVTLLVEYLEDAENTTKIICKGRRPNEAKKKALDKEVAVMKAVMECIEDCNLHSQFPIPSHKIYQRLFDLENKVRAITSDVEQSRKRRIDNAAEPQRRPPQIKIKYSGKIGSA